MKPAQARTLDPRMKEHEIDDRDLTRSRPTDPASLQSADPVLCPTPFEPGWAGDTRGWFRQLRRPVLPARDKRG